MDYVVVRPITCINGFEDYIKYIPFPTHLKYPDPLVISIIQQLIANGNQVGFYTSHSKIAESISLGVLPSNLRDKKTFPYINQEGQLTILKALAQICYPELNLKFFPRFTEVHQEIQAQQIISKINPFINSDQAFSTMKERFLNFFGNGFNDKYFYEIFETLENNISLNFGEMKFPGLMSGSSNSENIIVVDDNVSYYGYGYDGQPKRIQEVATFHESIKIVQFDPNFSNNDKKRTINLINDIAAVA